MLSNHGGGFSRAAPVKVSCQHHHLHPQKILRILPHVCLRELAQYSTTGTLHLFSGRIYSKFLWSRAHRVSVSGLQRTSNLACLPRYLWIEYGIQLLHQVQVADCEKSRV